MKKKLAVAGLAVSLFGFHYAEKEHRTTEAELPQNIEQTIVYADNFAGETDAIKIQKAIDFAAAAGNAKTVLLSDRNYTITSPIVIKEGVKLQFSYGSKLIVYGNFRVLELQKNASLVDPYIAIDDANFNSDVIYLDGKHKYYNTWYKTSIQNVNIVNWSGSNKGTGISLYAGGAQHEISFVEFNKVKIVGMHTGLKLKAVKPASGNSWINANRFLDFSLEDCVSMISLESSLTIPNEISGNHFENLQIQPSAKTINILKASGQFNTYTGMVWDMHLIPHTNSVVQFAKESSDSTFLIPSVPKTRISNSGTLNKINP